MSTAIKIQTTVSKDPQTTWDCYTLPEHIVNWNFASEDWHCPEAENEMTVGGKYRARMEAKDGSFGFDFEGVYQHIKPGESFGYQLEDGRNIEVIFKPQGDSTEVTVTFDADEQNPIDMQRNGWQAILDNFQKYTEQA